MKTLTVAVAFVIAVTSAAPANGPWPRWIERLGWTLVHSVWQLAAVALFVVLIDAWAGRVLPRRRYLVATATLGLMLLIPAATWLVWTPRPVMSPPSADAREPAARQSSPSPVSQLALDDLQSNRSDSSEPSMAPYPTPRPATDGSPDSESSSESGVAVAARREAVGAPSVEPPRAIAASETNSAGWIDRVQAGIEVRLEWFVWFWLAGVALFSCRPVCGVCSEWRLRHTGRSPVADSVEETLRHLARRMGITRTIAIAQSAFVRVPLVIGYLRPLILLPAGALAGLTPAQLEAVLAHELAHIRRHDWLVNALQVLAETVLFYHPAVWWISRRVRQSREMCCDDLALELVPDRAVFARALLLLEEFRRREPALSSTTLAATGGQLAARIRRLLPAPAGADPVARNWWAGAVLLIAIGLTGGVSLLAKPPSRSVEAAESEDVANLDEDSEFDPGDTATYSDNRKRIDADTGEPELRVVTVVDADGKPVPGARVRFQFKVTKEHLLIALNPVKTNAEGVAYSEIPAQADSVGIYVVAAGFGEGSAQELAAGKSRIVLKRGRVIQVRPVDRRGRFLKDAVPLLAGTQTWGREFTFKNPDLYESPSVDLGRRYLRVACSQADGPMLFSDPVDVTRDKPGPDGVFELRLTPGVRLAGRLDDSVPRPIQEGYVELQIVAGENGTLRGGPFWTWQDFTPVKPDGTFTFESLPAGCHAQLHVLVDGYMSKNPPVPERLNYLQERKLVDEERLQEIKEYVDAYDIWPHFVALDRPQVEVTIPCEPAAACDFLLLDPAGAPLPNATVSFSPNGVFVSGGLFIPGTEPSHALLVNGLRTGHENDQFFNFDDPSPHGQEAARRRTWVERSFLAATSDASGHVHIRNLPGGRHESFRAYAPGFVLPVSPLLDDQDLARGTSDDDEFDRNRFGLVDVQAGKTIAKTIYLERKQATVHRELTVVNRTGSPLEQVSLAVVELSTGEDQWQTWSQQRFGPTPRGTTDRLGRLILRLPSDIEGKNVERVRLGVNYFRNEQRSVEEEEQDPNKDLFVSRAIVEVPLAPDGGLISLLPNPEKPAGGGTRSGLVRYGRLEELLPGKNAADLLQALARHPNLAMLRALLAETKIRHPQPVELLDDSRRGLRRPGAKATGGVDVVSVGSDQFTIVEARVRPLVGPFSDKDGLNSLPECAYVFDQQGTLLAALGGEWGRTGSNSPDGVDVVNLGPREDWFVRVSRFEQNRSFEYLTEYYRVGHPVTPSLRLLHWANSLGWSIGPDDVKRYGELTFEFPDDRDGRRRSDLATLANDVKAVAGFVWDGNRNRFIGPAAPLLRGRPIYEVDVEWSKDFEALAPQVNQLVVTGGEYSYGYIWKMAVPDGMQALVKLTVPQGSGPAKVFEHALKPGHQKLQLYFKSDEAQKDQAVKHIELRISDPEQEQKFAKFEYALPDKPGDDPNENPPVIHILNPQQTSRLLQQPLASIKHSVVLEITLTAAPGTK